MPVKAKTHCLARAQGCPRQPFGSVHWILTKHLRCLVYLLALIASEIVFMALWVCRVFREKSILQLCSQYLPGTALSVT